MGSAGDAGCCFWRGGRGELVRRPRLQRLRPVAHGCLECQLPRRELERDARADRALGAHRARTHLDVGRAERLGCSGRRCRARAAAESCAEPPNNFVAMASLTVPVATVSCPAAPVGTTSTAGARGALVGALARAHARTAVASAQRSFALARATADGHARAAPHARRAAQARLQAAYPSAVGAAAATDGSANGRHRASAAARQRLERRGRA